MRTIRHALAAAILSVACAQTANADHNLWLGVKAGTLGAGLEAAWRPIPWLDLRLGANRFDYDDRRAEAGISYDAELSFDNYYGTANFRFPLSPMRFTAGAYNNGNELLLTSRDAPSFELAGTVYPGAAVGTLTSVASFDSIAPYVGVGFDFDVFDKVGLSLDFGVLWQGEPDITLEADGILGADPAFLQSLEAERAELEAELGDYKAWPVASLGFNYKFL